MPKYGEGMEAIGLNPEGHGAGRFGKRGQGTLRRAEEGQTGGGEQP